MIESIYSTIDIKVQSILFELNKEIKNVKGIKSVPGSPYTEKKIGQKPTAHSIPNEHKGEMRRKIEDSTDKIGRLLTLKSRVSKNNFDLIHSILSNDYYLEFSPKELNLIIGGNSVRQGA